MNRITESLSRLRAQGRKALVTYIVSGDPYPEASLPAMHALVAAGADIIELGVPFSDPMAEGPVIQRGHERALAAGTSLRSTLALVSAFRESNRDTPVVLMGYANPIERMGYRAFAEAAAGAGVDGVLTVDLPAEEAQGLNSELKAAGIETIFLLAPTTAPARAERIAAMASGFLYYVSLKGVTGAGHLDVDAVKAKLAMLRELTDLPLCVGFGIKDAASAKAIAASADGAVVGSLLVDHMGAAAAADSEAIAAGLVQRVAPIRAAINEMN
ncbi:tryptophan synthase subunit alpha [Exilibacterium tricleocarpae]|uniref:Tryptophan synthase alpha chain n=1 Tax=Exilibacterium tricleocarpae TaxID=2591008 RepID=A0A545SRX3_9GAMM|nr:tryptophan synthase subunit alpha [Exilibacterium tricleocarpae]TQV67695.1 tryptophan synthase subunit alpha [Exilibacterium tricleocarpae]